MFQAEASKKKKEANTIALEGFLTSNSMETSIVPPKDNSEIEALRMELENTLNELERSKKREEELRERQQVLLDRETERLREMEEERQKQSEQGLPSDALNYMKELQENMEARFNSMMKSMMTEVKRTIREEVSASKSGSIQEHVQMWVNSLQE